MTGCDKCGQPVPPENDASIITATRHENAFIILGHQQRHFLPVEGCEGSPSRAQYLQGQLRDTRGYPYDPSQEKSWRQAYAKVQADVKAGKYSQE